MSSLRGRTRDSSWQWLVIGVILGFGCSGVFCLGLYAVGSLRISAPGAPEVGAVPTIIIVTTPAPETATEAAPATSAVAVATEAVSANTTPSITPFLMNPTDDNAT